MSSRPPKKRKRATPFNGDVTARLVEMGYTLQPRPYGHQPRPLGEQSSSSSDESEPELSPSKKAQSGGEGMTIWEMMRRAEEGAARLDGRETPKLQDSSTDQLDYSDDSDSPAVPSSRKKKKSSKLKKERPKYLVEQLRGLVARHKERAVEAKEEIEERRRRTTSRREGVGKGKAWEWETPRSDAMDEEERKPSWKRRVGSDEQVDELESSDEDEEVKESERSRIGSPFKTPSSIFNKLSLASSSKKQLFPSSPSKTFALTSPSKSHRSIIPLPPSSPFHTKPPPSPRKSPTKPSLPSSSVLASVAVPLFLTSGKAIGARLLRKRVAWILKTGEEIASDGEKNEGREKKWWSRKVAKELAGCSEEWWRVNAGFKREERELDLPELEEFAVFAEGGDGEDPPVARYYSFVLHFKLCIHTEEECPHHRALVLYHSFRLPKGTVGKRSLPRRWDLESEETRTEWEEFGEWWEGMRERMGWAGEGRSRTKSLSPRKRKLEVKEEVQDEEVEFGD